MQSANVSVLGSEIGYRISDRLCETRFSAYIHYLPSASSGDRHRHISEHDVNCPSAGIFEDDAPPGINSVNHGTGITGASASKHSFSDRQLNR